LAGERSSVVYQKGGEKYDSVQEGEIGTVDDGDGTGTDAGGGGAATGAEGFGKKVVDGPGRSDRQEPDSVTKKGCRTKKTTGSETLST